MVAGMKGNCTKLERWNGTSWSLISKRVSITGPGRSRETVEEELTLDCSPTGGNPYKLKSPGTRELGDISVEVLWNPVIPTGTHQVETATGLGTVSVAGNAAVTITANGLTGSPVTYNIPVPTGVPTVWMPAIRTWLQTNAAAAALRAIYEVGGAGATLVLTSHEPQGNDTSLNIGIATGTATGITAAPTSVHTVPGVDGEENDENHHLFLQDYEAERATYWRILHSTDPGTGILVHATVKEIGEPSYEANANVKRTVVLEPTGEYIFEGNGVHVMDVPSSPVGPVDFWGR